MLCSSRVSLPPPRSPLPETARRCRNFLPSDGTPPCVVPFLGEGREIWGPSCCHTPGQMMMMTTTMMLEPPLALSPSHFFFLLLLLRSLNAHILYTVSGLLPFLTPFCLFLLLLVLVALLFIALLEHCYSLPLCMIRA